MKYGLAKIQIVQEKLGFKVNVQENPYPKLTWEVLEKLPPIITTGAVALGGIYWITKRRADVEREEGSRDSKPDSGGHGDR